MGKLPRHPIMAAWTSAVLAMLFFSPGVDAQTNRVAEPVPDRRQVAIKNLEAQRAAWIKRADQLQKLMDGQRLLAEAKQRAGESARAEMARIETLTREHRVCYSQIQKLEAAQLKLMTPAERIAHERRRRAEKEAKYQELRRRSRNP